MSRLRHAVTLARQGNFHRAAIDLHVSQSALSRSIQALEEQLGLRLFDRRPAGTFPTPAGRLFLQKASALLGAADDLEETMRRAWGQSGFTVRFGMGPLPASLWLSRLLKERVTKDGGNKFSCVVQSGMQLRHLVETEEIDFAICSRGSFELRGNLRAEHLVDIPTTVRVRRGHPLLQHVRMTVDDLAEYPFVGPNLSQSMARELAANSLIYDPVVACDDFSTLSDIVASSNGYCIFPVELVTQDLIDLVAAQPLISDHVKMMILWAGEEMPETARKICEDIARI